jgi:hypothetical protein
VVSPAYASHRVPLPPETIGQAPEAGRIPHFRLPGQTPARANPTEEGVAIGKGGRCPTRELFGRSELDAFIERRQLKKKATTG